MFEGPIVFVDFDGVLHPESPCYAERLFEHAAVLGKTLRQYGAHAVFSTTWRHNHSLKDLIQRVGPVLGSCVVGSTDSVDTLDKSQYPEKLQAFPRHLECVAWLRTNGILTNRWIALDDRPYGFYPFCSNLLVCDPKTGLTPYDISALGRRLAAMV